MVGRLDPAGIRTVRSSGGSLAGLEIAWRRLRNPPSAASPTTSETAIAILVQVPDVVGKIKPDRVGVREAVRQIETDIKRVRATRAARVLAERKLDAEEKKLEVGISTNFQVLEFQEDLAVAESNETKAIIDYNKSLINLADRLADPDSSRPSS